MISKKSYIPCDGFRPRFLLRFYPPPIFFQYLSVFSRFTFHFILFYPFIYQEEMNTPCFYNMWEKFSFQIRLNIIDFFYMTLYLSMQSGCYSFFAGDKFHFRFFSFGFYLPPFLYSPLPYRFFYPSA